MHIRYRQHLFKIEWFKLFVAWHTWVTRMATPPHHTLCTCIHIVCVHTCIGTIAYIIIHVYTCSCIFLNWYLNFHNLLSCNCNTELKWQCLNIVWSLMDLRNVWNMCGTHIRQWMSEQTDMYYIWMGCHRRPFIMLNKLCTPYFHKRLGLHTWGKMRAPKTCALGMCNYFFSMYSRFVNYNYATCNIFY